MTAVLEAPPVLTEETTDRPVMRKFIVRKGRHSEPIPACLIASRDEEDPFGHKRVKNRVRTFTEGQEVWSDRNLMEVFPGKFAPAAEPKQVSEARRSAVSELIKSSSWEEVDRDFLQDLSDDDFDRCRVRSIFKQSIDKVQSALGNDVTSKFSMAYDNGYLVFANNEGKHQIVKKGASNKPINKTALDANGVEGFIADLLKE